MVLKLVLLCALAAGTIAVAPTIQPTPRLEAVTAAAGTPREMSVFMRDIFTDEIADDPNTLLSTATPPTFPTFTPTRIWGLPKEPPGGLPFSATVLYLFWSTSSDAATGTTGLFNTVNFDTLTFSWDVQLPAGSVIKMKWESANLEVDPFYGCTGTGPSGDCRCNLADNQRSHQYMTAASMETDSFVGGVANNIWTLNTGTTPGLGAGTWTVNLLGLLPTYFDHAPFAGQNPFLRTYRRLCLQWATGTQAAGSPTFATTRWFDTNVMIAVTQPCIDPALNAGTLATDVPVIAATTAFVDNFLCTFKPLLFTYGLNNEASFTLATGAPQPSGLLGGYFEPFFQGTPAPVDETQETQDEGVADGETLAMQADRYARTFCCGFSGNVAAVSVNGDTTAFAPGVCIDVANSKAHCCGRRPYNPLADQCCQKPSSSVRYLDQPCPCFSAAIQTQATGLLLSPCIFNGANNADFSNPITVDVDRWAGLNDAPASPSAFCCNATRWGTPVPFSTGGTGANPDFVVAPNTVGINSFCVGQNGDTRWQCCDDGNVFDVGTSQCCPINGVQSLNLPCPCGVDTDCPSFPAQLCCTQIFPTPFALPHITGSTPVTCSKFANWPRSQQQLGSFQDFLSNAHIANQMQRCPGTCYNIGYQTCCNGRTCHQVFEKCCNDTCCNHYTESCMMGRRPGSWGNRWNPREWSVYYETCSQLEYLNGRKAFFVFVLPSILLFATLLSLAFVTILARRATEHIFELTERAMVFIAVAAVFLSCTYYFSPIYKNGVAIAFVALGAILIAVARKRAASLALVIVLFFLILYVIDPFSGNIYLSLTSNMPVRGAPKSSSLLEAALNMWVHNDRCTYYYQWFIHDNTLRDFERYDNPAQLTWGFCSRAWVTALMIFALMLYVLLLLLFLLAIFSLVKKLGIKDVEPIELEIAYDDAPVPFAPAPPAPVYFTG